eukprot:6210907-Pleurochrysis_carterae.AAC.3
MYWMYRADRVVLYDAQGVAHHTHPAIRDGMPSTAMPPPRCAVAVVYCITAVRSTSARRRSTIQIYLDTRLRYLRQLRDPSDDDGGDLHGLVPHPRVNGGQRPPGSRQAALP